MIGKIFIIFVVIFAAVQVHAEKVSKVVQKRANGGGYGAYSDPSSSYLRANTPVYSSPDLSVVHSSSGTGGGYGSGSGSGSGDKSPGGYGNGGDKNENQPTVIDVIDNDYLHVRKHITPTKKEKLTNDTVFDIKVLCRCDP